jgi:hypothetical protein
MLLPFRPKSVVKSVKRYALFTRPIFEIKKCFKKKWKTADTKQLRKPAALQSWSNAEVRPSVRNDTLHIYIIKDPLQ